MTEMRKFCREAGNGSVIFDKTRKVNVDVGDFNQKNQPPGSLTSKTK